MIASRKPRRPRKGGSGEYRLKISAFTPTKVIIPTPALSEALVRAGAVASQQIVEQLQKYSVFQIEPFDTRAAIEVAAMTRTALESGKKRGNSSATWAKVKYDRQIVAIAKVCGATTIYSDDGDIKSLAKSAKINVVGIADITLPPEKAQLALELTAPIGGSLKGTEIANDEERTRQTLKDHDEPPHRKADPA